jgi:hypothetical protein
VTEVAEDAAQWDVCGAEHPTARSVRIDGDKAEVEPVTCEMPPGTNACTDPVIEIDPLGNPIVTEPRRNVHVHRGVDAHGAVYRWGDE